MEKLFEYQWRGKIIFSHGTSGSKGVCVAFLYNLEYQLLKTICDIDGRYIIACVEIPSQSYILINCYTPNTENRQIQPFNELQSTYVSVNSKPDHPPTTPPPRQNLRQFFDGRIPHPRATRKFKTPTLRPIKTS